MAMVDITIILLENIITIMDILHINMKMEFVLTIMKNVPFPTKLLLNSKQNHIL